MGDRTKWYVKIGRSSRGPDLGETENRIIHSLYKRTAADLGLDSFAAGPVLCITDGRTHFRVYGTATDFDTVPAGVITGDKVYIRTLLEQYRLRVATGASFSSDQEREAVAFALSLGWPCVVKPARNTSSGAGVTVGLTTASRIIAAFRFAAAFDSGVLVEEFVRGENYRFLIYKGRCLSVLRREFPQVTGNGVDSVRRLAQRENQRRLGEGVWHEGDAMLAPLPLTKQAQRTLARQGLDWKSVPAAGCNVVLLEIAVYSTGCTYSEMLKEAHPEQISIAEEAARVAGLELAAVDIISPDLRLPVCFINEINTSPGIQMHYMVRNPAAATDPLRTILTDVFGISGARDAAGAAVGVSVSDC